MFQKELPFEAYLHISKYLPYEDLLTCELVNKSWRKAITYLYDDIINYTDIKYMSFKKQYVPRSIDNTTDTIYTNKALTIRAKIKKAEGILLIGGSFGKGNEKCALITLNADHTMNPRKLLDPWQCPLLGIGSVAAIQNKYEEIEIFGGWLSNRYHPLQDNRRILNNSFVCDFHQCHSTDTTTTSSSSSSSTTHSQSRNEHNYITKWRYQHPLPQKICFASAQTLINGEVILTGGSDTPYRDANVHTNCYIRKHVDMLESWESIAPLSISRTGHSSVTTYNNHVVVYGGYGGGIEYLSTGEYYDSHKDQWYILPPMNLARSGFCSVLDSHGCIFVAGGSSDGLMGTSSAARLDLRMGKWMEVKSMNYPRGYTAGCIGQHGCIYMTSGVHQDAFVESIEFYDPRNDSWIELKENMYSINNRDIEITENILSLREGHYAELLARCSHQAFFLL